MASDFLEDEHGPHELPELCAERDGVDRERHGEAEIEDHQQPAAGEDHGFDEEFETLHGGVRLR